MAVITVVPLLALNTSLGRCNVVLKSMSNSQEYKCKQKQTVRCYLIVYCVLVNESDVNWSHGERASVNKWPYKCSVRNIDRYNYHRLRPHFTNASAASGASEVKGEVPHNAMCRALSNKQTLGAIVRYDDAISRYTCVINYQLRKKDNVQCICYTY